MKQHPVAFAVAYALIGAQAIAAAAMFVVLLFTPVTPVAHKADVNKAAKDAAGNQNLVALCEANLTQQVNQAYGTVNGYSGAKTTVKGTKATVKVKLSSNIYTGVVTCEFQKSNWALSNVAAA